MEKDLGLLLFQNLDKNNIKNYQGNNEVFMGTTVGKEETYYVTDSSCTHLKRIEDVNKGKLKVQINLTELNKGMPDSIYIDHKNYEFNISLKQIQQ